MAETVTTPLAGAAPVPTPPVLTGVPTLWTALAVGCGALCLLLLAQDAHRDRARRRRHTAVLAAGGGPARTGHPGRTGPPRTEQRCAEAATPPAGRRNAPATVREGALALAAGLGLALALGGVTGVAWGALAAAGAWQAVRRGRAADARHPTATARRAAAAHLPLAADLLAACLAAGASPHEAAAAVGGALGGPLGARLTRVAAEARLGAEPAVAWRHVGQLPEAHGLARRMARAAATGAPAVAAVTRLAADARTRRAREAQVRARRAGVLVTGPLGLCFLPAFLLLGVAPVVLGLADALW